MGRGPVGAMGFPPSSAHSAMCVGRCFGARKEEERDCPNPTADPRTNGLAAAGDSTSTFGWNAKTAAATSGGGYCCRKSGFTQVSSSPKGVTEGGGKAA